VPHSLLPSGFFDVCVTYFEINFKSLSPNDDLLSLINVMFSSEIEVTLLEKVVKENFQKSDLFNRRKT
jgi:hypothetical protein